ncbi:MAG: ATP-binding protein, partial [Myxococcota bacterium]
EPPPKPAAPKPAPKAAAQRDTIVQVRRSKIQELLSIASDLGLSTDGLLSHPGVQQLREDSEDLTEKAHRLRRLMRDLRFAAAGLALVPVNELYAKVKRIGRELQRATGKVFTLEFEGEETEIDKSLVDALSDPVLHIIRNAVDHGIESADDRVAAAKPRQGKVTVSASYSGNEVLLVFSDDGKGLNGEVLRRKAIERGLITETDNLDTTAIHRLILHPGFSTRDTVTELSGRGVGMDVVSESIKQLRGRIDIRSVQGQGTSFLIFLPLTLAFSDALVVEAGPFLYAIPLENVGRILLPEESDWTENRASSAEMLRVQGNLYPVHWITGTGGEREGDEQRKPVVVVQTSGGGVALPVDFLRGTEQITMRPLSGLTRHHPAASSCGILSNGDLALTLDCERLIKVRADDDESDRASASS